MTKAMKIQTMGLIAAASLGVSLMTGCAQPAAKQSSIPPHLVSSDGIFAHQYNKTGHSFGPVPKSLQALGKESCEEADLGKLEGYHSRAEYSDRTHAPDGGFLCDAPPPLIDQNVKA
jgi:hypothetical protein